MAYNREPIDVEWEPIDPYEMYFSPPRQLGPGRVRKTRKRRPSMSSKKLKPCWTALNKCKRRGGKTSKACWKKFNTCKSTGRSATKGRKRRGKVKCRKKCPTGMQKVCVGGFRKKGGHRKGRVCRKYVCRKT